MNNRIGIVYLCIHEKLVNESPYKQVSKKRFSEIIGKLFHIPKEYHTFVLMEMQSMKLLNQLDRKTIQMNGGSGLFEKNILALKKEMPC